MTIDPVPAVTSRPASSLPSLPISDLPRTLCVVIHDVAPATWERCRFLIDRLDAIARARGLDRMPLTLLAVPRYHGGGRDAAFERWLAGRAALGDDVALHGLTHRDETATETATGPLDRLRRNVYTRGEGEFWALDEDEAARRISIGLAWLSELGIRPPGFVAPAWLLGPGAWRALARQPFTYTCTVRRLHLLHPPRALVAQSQVYSTSSAWRRLSSRIWCRWLGASQRRQPVVRLELHPTDIDPAIVRSWERLARRQAATRRVVTLAALAGELAGPPGG